MNPRSVEKKAVGDVIAAARKRDRSTAVVASLLNELSAADPASVTQRMVADLMAAVHKKDRAEAVVTRMLDALTAAISACDNSEAARDAMDEMVEMADAQLAQLARMVRQLIVRLNDPDKELLMEWIDEREGDRNVAAIAQLIRELIYGSIGYKGNERVRLLVALEQIVGRYMANDRPLVQIREVVVTRNATRHLSVNEGIALKMLWRAVGMKFLYKHIDVVWTDLGRFTVVPTPGSLYDKRPRVDVMIVDGKFFLSTIRYGFPTAEAVMEYFAEYGTE